VQFSPVIPVVCHPGRSGLDSQGLA